MAYNHVARHAGRPPEHRIFLACPGPWLVTAPTRANTVRMLRCGPQHWALAGRRPPATALAHDPSRLRGHPCARKNRHSLPLSLPIHLRRGAQGDRAGGPCLNCSSVLGHTPLQVHVAPGRHCAANIATSALPRQVGKCRRHFCDRHLQRSGRVCEAARGETTPLSCRPCQSHSRRSVSWSGFGCRSAHGAERCRPANSKRTL